MPHRTLKAPNLSLKKSFDPTFGNLPATVSVEPETKA
jgi:hypothetical protein